MNQYRLDEGDVIKFGRVRFRVKKLAVDNSIIDPLGDDNIDYPSVPTKSNIIDSSVNNHLRA
jgi:hypothetical protein